MPPELAEELDRLWEDSATPPDVFAILDQYTGLDAAQKLTILLKDQEHRWRKDCPLSVEDYLTRLPELAVNPDVRRELEFGEFQARKNGNAAPSLDESTSRFGALSDTLIRSRFGESDDRLGGESTLAEIDDTVGREEIGRYRLVRRLGEGAFGRVWLAEDAELQRLVAIKEPKPERFQRNEDAEAYLREARMVARLDHPNIVPVYDMGRTDAGSVYVVSKYIAGQTLEDQIKEGRPSPEVVGRLLEVVAHALQHAHDQRLIHRDLKPANILLEESTATPYVTDFGLAIREDDFLAVGHVAGTPAYMSPEQSRGEGHRLDGRSDIFSLGIVFYELLTGIRPFRGRSTREILTQIASAVPRPPRELDDSIPAELERICLKALSKRASDRYASAADLADDLRHWQQGTDQHVEPVQIVPRGLRSFDSNDSDFFLDLLPGPRNRTGLPESIQFWKSRVEEADPNKTFNVGLIYGPSGCGKSSLMKAGLLPRLSPDIASVYIEATPDDTEARILKGLRQQLPHLPVSANLVETLTLLRKSEGRQVLIVLDQFEQWLHAHPTEGNTGLVTALRQCDGGNLQAIVMVRDDFSMAASRFMRALETRIIEGHNFATVDLFDEEHARRVLVKFGQAFGKLSMQTGEMTDEQQHFVNRVAAGLAKDGQVVCVHLALFAEMVKGKPWRLSTLDDIGGTDGVGVNFLEDTFSSRNANPEQRRHQDAARKVLRGLLPEAGSDIKGHMRSYDELLSLSGYGSRPQEFDELISILDGELRLITPTDPDGDPSEIRGDAGFRYFQLTHDHLVSSLRVWLTRKQKETRRGRAELRLAERSALWNAKPENRHLPNWWEWATIRMLTDKSSWTEPERSMMGRAGRVLGLYSGLGGIAVLLLVVVGSIVADGIEQRQNANYAKALVESLSASNTADVEGLVVELSQYQQWAALLLKEIVGDERSSPTAKLHASLVLARDDPSQLEFLGQQLLVASPTDVPVIVKFLKPYKEELTARQWDIVRDGSKSQRLRAAAALAQYDPTNGEWEETCEDVATALVSVSAAESEEWIDALRPVGSVLSNPLEQRFRESRGRRSYERPIAATALSVYLEDQPERLKPLVLLGDEEAEFRPLLSALRSQGPSVTTELKSFVRLSPPSDLLTDDRDDFWKEQANAAICLLEFDEADSVWPLFGQTTDPSLRSLIIDRFARLGGSSKTVVERLKQETDPVSRYALILTLGQFDRLDMPTDQRHSLRGQLAMLYREDPDPGVHSATAWTLQKWGLPLPQLPNGEPTLSEQQRQRIETLQQAMNQTEVAIEEERATRIEEWGAKISRADKEVASSSEDTRILHYQFDTFPPSQDDADSTHEPGIVLHGDPPPQLTTGVFGHAMDFRDGSYATGSTLKLSTVESFTVGGWFLFRQTTGMGLISNRDKRNRLQGFELFFQQPGRFAVHLYDQVGRIQCTTREILGTPDCWHHVVVTYDGSRTADGLRIYVDGKSRDVEPGISSSLLGQGVIESPVPLHFGTRPIGVFSFTPLDGAIDDVSVFNRELTDQQVRHMYILGIGRIASIPAGERSTGFKNALSHALTDIIQIETWDDEPTETEEKLARLESEKLKVHHELRRWFVNSQGQTFAVFNGPVELQIGEESKRSPLRTVMLEHTFAVATHEVTTEQFKAFRSDHEAKEEYVPEPECPAVNVSWYDCVAYCNWLSEQEGIPKDQWCYEPNDQGESNRGYVQGMTIAPDFLSRTGYRLPTNEEWEYVCRAGTTSKYAYGEPVELLPRYAWYVDNSQSHAWPVGMKLPNAFGLFDAHGNASERGHSLSSLTSVAADTQVKNSDKRTMHGGAFHVFPSVVRSAHWDPIPPNLSAQNYGFRPVRTLAR